MYVLGSCNIFFFYCVVTEYYFFMAIISITVKHAHKIDNETEHDRVLGKE